MGGNNGTTKPMLYIDPLSDELKLSESDGVGRRISPYWRGGMLRVGCMSVTRDALERIIKMAK